MVRDTIRSIVELVHAAGGNRDCRRCREQMIFSKPSNCLVWICFKGIYFAAPEPVEMALKT